MAEDLQMYQPDLSALENNKPGCSIRDLAKLEMIAGYLNVPLGYLLFGEGEDIEKEDAFTEYSKVKSPISQTSKKWYNKLV